MITIETVFLNTPLNPLTLTFLEVSFTQGRYSLRSSLMNFLQFPASTDYISSVNFTCYGLPTSTRLRVLPSGGIVVEVSPFRSLPADYPFFLCLGFNLAPYNRFFLLSPPSRLSFFHLCVVALLSLGYSSNSGSRRGLQVLATHRFLYALTLLRLISP